ncbi:MAG: HAMP domain-containing histidine kinase [Maribacter sp.]|nr:HAMP domain-containing histidine kinase [Maribacter sp.]
MLNEIKHSFDEAVDYHYDNTSKNSYMTFIDNESDSISEPDILLDFMGNSEFVNYLKQIDTTKNEFETLEDQEPFPENTSIELVRGKNPKETQDVLDYYSNKVTIEIIPDSVDFFLINKVLSKKLAQSKIKTPYQIQHYKHDTIFSQFGNFTHHPNLLETISTSELIPTRQSLKLRFQNPARAIFVRGSFGILLSLVLSLSIILSLYLLVNIIFKQKQLVEIKNDLISNITHEFKTPIATVLAALESITAFNPDNDSMRNKKYFEISKEQLHKLDGMVEKLLETAALDSQELEIQKSPHDIAPIINRIVKQYSNTYPNKKFIKPRGNKTNIEELDLFHFENAINNILDNAVKYGGDTIRVGIIEENTKTVISIIDNGNGIPLKLQKKIFEKFYRIPSGNVHDVKGFGIGLYYSKNVIEKHGGLLTLISNPTIGTEFKIYL